MANKPVLHRRDHERGGADPIRLNWEAVDGGGGGGTEWIEATLINGWTGVAYYRRSIDGIIELAGGVGDGTTATVAFVLPSDHRPDNDVSYLACETIDSVTFNAARVTVTAADGNVTITYPMS